MSAKVSIKELRIGRNLTQRELAELTCLSLPYLNKIENGKYIPHKKLLVRIAAVLGVKIHEISLKEKSPVS